MKSGDAANSKFNNDATSKVAQLVCWQHRALAYSYSNTQLWSTGSNITPRLHAFMT